MSRYFVTDGPVPIAEFDPAVVESDVPPNVISIRPKMDMATKAKVTSEMFTMGKDNALEARLGANELALLLHNVLGWSGPDFDGVPCTPDNIRKLDPTEPHIARVLEEIAIRNKSPKAPAASATSSTSSSNGATALITPSRAAANGSSAPLGSGVSRSPLLNAAIGRPSRSDD